MHSFLPEIVDASRPDGYWIEAFPHKANDGDNTPPHIIGYGLGTATAKSEIKLYINPLNTTKSPTNGGWEKQTIASLDFPVACSYADISRNGFNDVILSDRYGPGMNDIWPDGGRVSWFANPGNLQSGRTWERRYIGRFPGMHRLKAGHFTTRDTIEVVAVPIVVKSGDLTTPPPVIVFKAPPDAVHAKPDDDTGGWPYEEPFPCSFRLVHEVYIVHGAAGGLDRILLAGREGVSLIWYDASAHKWESKTLGEGLPEEAGNPYWGSGSVALGRVNGDTTGYIGSCEAFHGNHVSVYTKPPGSPKDALESVKWKRHVLTDFGALNDVHTGSIHQVVCADIDGDGVDELLVALMGSDPPSLEKTGVWCYKPTDLVNGKFERYKLCDESAGRIALGHFAGRPGLLDFATISYSVPGYFESPNPSVHVYTATPITAERLNDELLFRIPNPSTTRLVDEVEFLDVASRKMALVVVPPLAEYPVKRGDGVKVILGSVEWKPAGSGNTVTRSQATAPFTSVSILVDAQDERIRAGADGAAFVLFKQSNNSGQPPYTDMDQVVTHNILPARFPASLRNMTFPWVKVEDRPWANGRFQGVEFYNLVGFHVRLADDSLANVCHVQLWTAGVNVSAGFHNHADAVFCEIHACIANGTGQGGMAWATVPDEQLDPAHPDPAKYKKIAVRDMEEHGPLWRTTRDGVPLFRANGTVDYPWHAWLAGEGDPKKQAYDIWVAFEFPPLVALAAKPEVVVPKPGTYRLRNAALKLVAVVKDGDATDGVKLVAVSPKDQGQQEAQWTVGSVPGTNMVTLQNVKTTSSATADWPPISGKSIVGSRSPATLGITSRWFVTDSGGSSRIWLIDSKLVWTISKNNEIVLGESGQDEDRQKWQLEKV